MPADPSDIASLINDGVLITTDVALGNVIKATHADAQPVGTPTEIEMFYDDPAVAQVMLNEKWSFNRTAGAAHFGVELQDNVGLGSQIALTPIVPTFIAVDARLDLSAKTRTRSFAHDFESDRYPIEIMA